MSIANMDIRNMALEKDVKLWKVAEKLGMADSCFSRKLRKELNDVEKAKVFEAIEEISGGKL